MYMYYPQQVSCSHNTERLLVLDDNRTSDKHWPSRDTVDACHCSG